MTTLRRDIDSDKIHPHPYVSPWQQNKNVALKTYKTSYTFTFRIIFTLIARNVFKRH